MEEMTGLSEESASCTSSKEHASKVTMRRRSNPSLKQERDFIIHPRRGANKPRRHSAVKGGTVDRRRGRADFEMDRAWPLSASSNPPTIIRANAGIRRKRRRCNSLEQR